MDIAQALKILTPGANYDISGNTYAGINWARETVQTKPTEQAINDVIVANQYKSDRENKYPHLAVLADAIYWNEKGDPTKMVAYVTACDTVKTDHPKP